jgi:methionyl-tRNA synthetase
MADTFYITTPIFYPNAKLHMGHAYTTTLTDVLARYYRQQGSDTYFLTGSDEHTQKVLREAHAAGKTAQTFADENVEGFKALFTRLEISYDQFIRTSDRSQHWPGAIQVWQQLKENGDIYSGTYEGYYCEGCETFLSERDLIDGKCPDHGTEPEYRKQENYFFALSRYEKTLRERIDSGALEILPSWRAQEMRSLIDEGLEDVSFSRPADSDEPWGIPVPGDESQVMYVWCDALTNYITALGYGTDDTEHFDHFWPAQYHVVGKDILRFHALIWPAMLISAGLPLPERILAHGMITSGGYKMSKTRGNVIDPVELMDRFGVEAVRYYLAREISPFEDGDVTYEAFTQVYNANLANGIGNLAARIMKMASKYLEEPVAGIDGETNEVIEKRYRYHMDRAEVHHAMDVIFERIGQLDSYITEHEPFKTIKTDENKAKTDVAHLVAGLLGVAHMLEPIMPETAAAIQYAAHNNEPVGALFPRVEEDSE